ncbi:MAG: DUF1569 domain-containing protein [Saprospiraceae bacterium]
MKSNTILNKGSHESILRRIYDLKSDSVARFGKMNVNQMLCHTADQLRIAMSFIEIPLQGNRVSRYFKKQIALTLDNIPSEKVDTLDEINQEKEGTKPVGFEDDKVNLIKLIDLFLNNEEHYSLQHHPMFGNLDREEWGQLIYVHLNHHLKQFGV